MTVLSVRHVTTYRYKRPVSFGHHRIMFRPRDSYDQKLIEASLAITPQPRHVRWLHDPFGNCIAIAEFAEKSDALQFESHIRLDHSFDNVPDFQIEDYAKTYPFSYRLEEMADLVPAIERQYSDPDQEVYRWVRGFLRNGRPTETATLLTTINRAIQEGFTYERRYEPGTCDPALTLKLRRGSCRDLALLMIEAVRSLDLAARFVSGYLYVATRDGPQAIGGGSTHAWCQVYLPGAGWVEFDPTNGIVGNRDLIRVAVARDPSQAVPLSGTWRGPSSCYLGMEVDVKVRAEAAVLEKSAPAAAPKRRGRPRVVPASVPVS
jgi:transglutaminase-like putative cysteine protease